MPKGIYDRSQVKHRSIPGIDEVSHYWDKSESHTIELLLDDGILAFPDVCEKCGASNTYRFKNKTKKQLRCNVAGCRHQRSLFQGSFFSGCRLPLTKLMLFLYHWLSGVQCTQLKSITEFSSTTVTNYLLHVKQLVIDDIDTHQEVIGGPDVIVEVDESKFAKRKYHRGHRVASKAWIFGGIERTPERKFFAVQVNDRSAETLSTVMKCFIHSESIVYSDCWKGYTNLVAKGICKEHKTVNHSVNYVDPESGAHTNSIEGHWGVLKGKIPKRKRTDDQVEACILEQVWRHHNKDDLWNALKNALASVKYAD